MRGRPPRSTRSDTLVPYTTLCRSRDRAAEVRATRDRLSGEFHDGLVHRIAYDPTIFVKASIESGIVTLIEATLLVVLVVILFLQTWRASIIPLVSVPVSLFGPLSLFVVLGFYIGGTLGWEIGVQYV